MIFTRVPKVKATYFAAAVDAPTRVGWRWLRLGRRATDQRLPFVQAVGHLAVRQPGRLDNCAIADTQSRHDDGINL